MLAEKKHISEYEGWVSLIYSYSLQLVVETPNHQDYIHLSTNGSCWRYFPTVLCQCKFTQHNTWFFVYYLITFPKYTQ